MLSARLAVGLLAGCAPILAVGCGDRGPQRYPVSGTVLFKGQPVKLGTINFRSDSGETGGGEIRDGRYELPTVGGLPAGTYRVAICYPDPKIPPPKDDEPPGEIIARREMLPAKYNNQTELTANVEASSRNEVNFDLK